MGVRFVEIFPGVLEVIKQKVGITFVRRYVLYFPSNRGESLLFGLMGVGGGIVVNFKSGCGLQ